jgi:NAD+ kinase
VRIEVKEDVALTLLFDKGQSLEERIVAEQFITA